MAIAIRTWQIYFTLIILSFFIYYITHMGDITTYNWDMIGAISAGVFTIVSGVFAVFAYIINMQNSARNKRDAERDVEHERTYKMVYEKMSEISDSQKETQTQIKDILSLYEENRAADAEQEQKIQHLQRGHSDHETRLRIIEQKIK